MIRTLLAITALATLPGSAESDDVKKGKLAEMLESLPIGATLSNFNHTHYTPDKKPSFLLTSEFIKVEEESSTVSKKVLVGEKLVIRQFNENTEIASTTLLDAATFNFEKELIETHHHLDIRATDKKYAVQGQGGILHLRSQQGLIFGPAQTMFTLPPKKPVAMKLTAPLLLATLPLLTAAPPPPITPEELADFELAVMSKYRPPSTAEADFAKAEEAEIGLTTRLTQFLTTTGQLGLLAQQQQPSSTPANVDELTEDELFKPSTDRIIISSDQGVYFDGKDREFAYLGKVTVVGKGIALTCTDGVKALMLPPPPEKEKKKDEKKEEKEGGLFDNFQSFGDLKQITANGNVVLRGKNENGEPVEARADRALYNAKNSTFILRGKNIYLRQGKSAFRNRNPKASLKIVMLEDGTIKSIQTEGYSEMVISDELFKKNKKKK